MIWGILLVWNFVGFCILAMCADSMRGEDGAMGQAQGWEFVNPLHIYKHNRLNWFGTILLALWYNLLCPIMSLGYWFYKLCTVGRR